MSREIKFRAWNPNSNRFDSYAGDIHMSLGEAGALWSKNIPMEFQQYTGLKDKNGVEIYEGDVIYLNLDDANSVVQYEEGGFYCHWIYEGYDTSLRIVNETNEVIGNIYENPELVA